MCVHMRVWQDGPTGELSCSETCWPLAAQMVIRRAVGGQTLPSSRSVSELAPTYLRLAEEGCVCVSACECVEVCSTMSLSISQWSGGVDSVELHWPDTHTLSLSLSLAHTLSEPPSLSLARSRTHTHTHALRRSVQFLRGCGGVQRSQREREARGEGKREDSRQHRR